MSVRTVKWLIGIVAALILLVAAVVVIVTVFVDPNRFKGRIERFVEETTGRPLHIDGDLDIAWYPWLAVRTGTAKLGSGEPLLRWKSARVGVRLIPLIRGELIVSRVRLDGLDVRLERDENGKANWEGLLPEGGGSSGGSLKLGGLDIREGALTYIDARNDTYLKVSDWTLELDEWQPGRPFSIDTRFVLQNGAGSRARIPIMLEIPKIQMSPAVSVPQFELHLADASLEGSVELKNLEPLEGNGNISIVTDSLRKLLADLEIAGPRPRDATTLGPFRMKGRWAAADGAIAVKPIELKLDETTLQGELNRSAESAWHFDLKGDRIALGRYTDIEDTGEPFELPTALLKSLPIAGTLSFDEAELKGARLKNVRLRVEDGKLHEP